MSNEPIFIKCIAREYHNGELQHDANYKLENIDKDKKIIQVINRQGNLSWYPMNLFDFIKGETPRMTRWYFDDFEEDNINEIYIEFDDGTIRWCFISTLEQLSTCGYMVIGSKTARWHEPCRNMFILTEVTVENVDSILNESQDEQMLFQYTSHYGSISE